MSYSLTWLPGVLDAAGLQVAPQKGWEDRGRGDVGRIQGVICHHTAVAAGGNMPALHALINGRAAGPGVTALAGPPRAARPGARRHLLCDRGRPLQPCGRGTMAGLHQR